MVSLSLMARLLEAVRPDARLVLVGDPGQLTSIEAGAVLGDIVGPSRCAGPAMRRAATACTATAARHRRDRRGDPARRRRRGRSSSSRAGAEDVTWIDADATSRGAAMRSSRVRAARGRAASASLAAARAGDARAALDALGAFRVLCAHRRGPHGVARVERRDRGLAGAAWPIADRARWYVGRPLLVTENDYELRLFNGDTGVVVRTGDGRMRRRLRAPRRAASHFSPPRLRAGRDRVRDDDPQEPGLAVRHRRRAAARAATRGC